jgi:hypothetical protein
MTAWRTAPVDWTVESASVEVKRREFCSLQAEFRRFYSKNHAPGKRQCPIESNIILKNIKILPSVTLAMS